MRFNRKSETTQNLSKVNNSTLSTRFIQRNSGKTILPSNFSFNKKKDSTIEEKSLDDPGSAKEKRTKLAEFCEENKKKDDIHVMKFMKKKWNSFSAFSSDLRTLNSDNDDVDERSLKVKKSDVDKKEEKHEDRSNRRKILSHDANILSSNSILKVITTFEILGSV